ncbi:MAG: outer membrane protein assembly factor BamA [Geminicoccaceae bacterium]|nr:outer membrane protein assembly factor BamA [Geminicoccaceae bacterium]MCB9944642.1 outer membrane protein assembly factor BamA [Geminicoccaceae bacterium]
MLSVIGALLFLATQLPIAFPVRAESPDDRIQNIIIEGNQRIEDATVESYLSIHRGDTFDSTALDNSLKNLFATGLFDDVVIRRTGNDLVVSVVENPIVNRVAFEGNLRIEDSVLESEVQIRPRVVYTRARVQTAVSRILELYRRNGRYAAQVNPKIIELDQNRVDLVFEIEEGPETKVAGISFIGNEKFSDNTLRGVIETKESAFWRILSSADTYDPDRLAFDQELLRRFYLERGYAEFAVVSAIAELTPDGSAFYITFTVDEGDLYHFGKIDLESSIRDLSLDDLRSLVQTEEGEVYNANQVESTIQALTDKTGELGYAFANIDPVTQIDRDALTIAITYSIAEGQRVYVDRINITGNVRTLDEVIRREMRLSEGDAYNVALLRRSQQRIRNLGYFDSVDVTTSQAAAADRIDINVKVSERSTGELSFGAGFSTSDGPLFDIRLTERNLLGTGNSISSNLTVSGRRQDVEFSYTNPYFLDRELAAGIDVFRRRTDFQSESSFDETSTGGVLRADYPLTEHLHHSVRYTLREDKIESVSNSASVFIREEEGSRITSSIGETFTYDLRDTRFLPSEGYLLRLDQELAGLGGDNKFIMNEGRADYYYQIYPDVVLNLGAGFGYIHGLTGEDVHLSNRFFIGGSSLRGFKAGGIGPRDSETDDSLGGNLYYTGTAEVRFPLGLPEELRMFGRTFVDVGSLHEIDVHGPTLIDNSDPRVGAGIGLSWLSPLGPLSIDFAQAVVKKDEDQTESFRISFGTRF